jgi:hypothetical protein
MANESVQGRIDRVSAHVENRLKTSLTNGKIDLQKLKTQDPALHAVLDAFAESKTWRDDPEISAVDVAKLLEAQSNATRLGAALEKLKSTLQK